MKRLKIHNANTLHKVKLTTKSDTVRTGREMEFEFSSETEIRQIIRSRKYKKHTIKKIYQSSWSMSEYFVIYFINMSIKKLGGIKNIRRKVRLVKGNCLCLEKVQNVNFLSRPGGKKPDSYYYGYDFESYYNIIKGTKKYKNKEVQKIYRGEQNIIFVRFFNTMKIELKPNLTPV